MPVTPHTSDVGPSASLALVMKELDTTECLFWQLRIDGFSEALSWTMAHGCIRPLTRGYSCFSCPSVFTCDGELLGARSAT